MEDKYLKIFAVVILALMIATASISALGLVSLKLRNDAALNQTQELKETALEAQKILQDEKTAKLEAENRIKQLTSDMELLAAQNATLRKQAQAINQSAQLEIDYEAILKDITKLTVQNCNEAISYAKEKEEGLEEERENLLDDVASYQRKVDERKQDLKNAIDARNETRIDTELKRVEYMQENLEEAEEILDDFDEYELSKLRQDRSRAEAWCRRLIREL